ncbi:VOC family protein [Enterococcus hailinensis]|uniref:VOC family protein n=1 Tax=Enterococcus hailinensis TaxID=3238988 RepID=UPI0038B402DD
MSTIVFTNFPVKDLSASTEFYEKLGFKKDESMSTETASTMIWDDTFWIMILKHELYQLFLKNKKIADAQTVSGVLTSFTVENPAAVRKFAELAKANGGDYFSVDMDIPEEEMFSLEVVDLDGNQLEPVWMRMP